MSSSASNDSGDRETAKSAELLVPSRHPLAPAPGAYIASHYPRCFGCGSDVPTGLRLRVRAEEGLRVSAEFEVTPDHQGAPGLAHGGILAAALDESLGALNWLLRTPAVTGTLETVFRAPVPVGSRLRIDARITAVAGRKVYTQAVGCFDEPDRRIAIEGKAIFIQVPLEHFRRHGSAAEVERVARERAVAPGGAGHSLEVNP